MKNRPEHSIPHQLVMGAIAIALGLIFLVDNFGWWHVHDLFDYWPVILIIIGISKLFEGKETQHYFGGMALIVVGVILMAQSLGIFSISWHKIWPIFLVLLGINFVLKALSARDAQAGPKKLISDDDSTINATAICAAIERSIISKDFRGGEITVVMGGCELDLRQSNLQQDAVLQVQVIFGGISIKVPSDWCVVLHGTPILGGFVSKTMPPPENSKRLIIKGNAILGGVDVRN